MNWFKKTKIIEELTLKVINLSHEKESLEREVRSLTKKLKQFEPPPKVFKVGDRVKGSATCGFNAAMHGTITYITPNNEKIWVHRDGASGDVFYVEHELEWE